MRWIAGLGAALVVAGVTLAALGMSLVGPTWTTDIASIQPDEVRVGAQQRGGPGAKRRGGKAGRARGGRP